MGSNLISTFFVEGSGGPRVEVISENSSVRLDFYDQSGNYVRSDTSHITIASAESAAEYWSENMRTLNG